MRQFTITTGNINYSPSKIMNFTMGRDAGTIHLAFDEDKAEFSIKEYPNFLKQVSFKSPEAWANLFTSPNGPMCQPDVQVIITHLHTTPSFQLFLAGVNIAQFVLLTSDHIMTDTRVKGLIHNIKQIDSTRNPQLYFLHEAFVQKQKQEELDELVRHNFLCRFYYKMPDDKEIVKYFTPYVPPIKFFDVPVAGSIVSLQQKIYELKRNV